MPWEDVSARRIAVWALGTALIILCISLFFDLLVFFHVVNEAPHLLEEGEIGTIAATSAAILAIVGALAALGGKSPPGE